ncbi:MAG: hypothetical protein J4N66_09075 [Chloroflexi bacterium]|nr:hypothetical protein [Chloroflexota bacterium]
MAKRSRKSSTISGLSSFPTDNVSVEAAWREALGIQEFGRDERVKSRKRLARAQVARMQAENEAITATKNYSVRVRAQADQRLQQADRTLAEAERIKADAIARTATLEDEIQFRLDDASRKRANALSYAEKLENTARGAADALMSQTRDGAKELASRMRHDAAEDIRKILTDIEVARAAAEDELEAQRLLTQTAQVKAFTVGIDTGAAKVKPLTFTSARKNKPAKRTASANKRSAKTTTSTPRSVRKAA